MRLAPFRSALLALASCELLAACATCCPRTAASWASSPSSPAPRPTPTLEAASPPKPQPFDRERERRAVMRAVLVGLYRGAGTKRFVVDKTLRAGGPEQEPLDDREVERLRKAGLHFEEPLKLSDGSRVFRPTMKELDGRLVDDWAAHGASSPTPVDLDAPLPIDWVSEADWSAVEVRVGADGIDIDATWEAFHRRHPGSEGWVHLADVGFSPAGDAALTYAWSLSGSLAGGGAWILLETACA